jgi:hypothetical protein
MFSPTHRAPFLVALFLGFAMFVSAAQVRAQDSCPAVKNYFPRIGYPGYGVIVQGINFQGVTEVKFAENIAAKFEVLNAEELSVVIPLGAVSGPVTIGKPGCAVATAGIFTVPPPPRISLAPAAQTVSAGGEAPIGVNFTNGLIAPTILSLDSSNPLAVSVPPILLVPSGAGLVTFNATGLMAGATATITATLPPNLGSANAAAEVSVISPIVRVIRLGVAGGRAGSSLGVPIETVAEGDEHSIQFSLTFDPAVLGNPQVFLGMSLGYDTMITADSSQTAQGRIGITLTNPPGQPLPPGNKQIVFVRFDIAGNAPGGETPLGFDDQPTRRRITSPSGARLPASFTPGKATIER